MRIILIANYPHDRQESMKRFADALAHGLEETGIPVKTIRPEPFFGKLKPGATGLGKWLGYLDKFILFPFRLRKLAWDAKGSDTVFHICDHSNAMYGAWLRDVPVLVTCNDLLAIRSAIGEFSQNRTQIFGRILQKWILKSLQTVPRLVCISKETQADVIRLADRSTADSIVIYMGMNYLYTKMDPSIWIKELKALGERTGFSFRHKFLFHVGGSQWYKNRIGLIRIYRELVRLDSTVPNLLIAGKPHTAEVEREIMEYGMSQRVHYIGRVSNEELNALYAGAEAFLFPSLAEGFGWPIIEAQSSGCPVVTTNRPPMNEIGSEAAVYVDPENPKEAAAKVAELLAESGDEREQLMTSGLTNAARFSTERMIREYMQEYERLLSAV